MLFLTLVVFTFPVRGPVFARDFFVAFATGVPNRSSSSHPAWNDWVCNGQGSLIFKLICGSECTVLNGLVHILLPL